MLGSRLITFLLVMVVLIAELSEGKKGGGSSGRGPSKARVASRPSKSKSSSSSSSTSGSSWFKSKASSKSSTWFTGGTSHKNSYKSLGGWTSSAPRSGSGFRIAGSSHSTSHPRPPVTPSQIFRGVFPPRHTYYSSGPYYPVYHYYPRTRYYSTHRTTTPQPIGPNSSQVSQTLQALQINETDYTNYDNTTEYIKEIVDPSRPMIIQDLAFFWDKEYLPKKNSSGCVSLRPSNTNTTIEYCEVKQFDRCSNELKNLPGFVPEDVVLPGGKAPTHLAWLCPKTTRCCEWECCHDETESNALFYLWLVILFGLMMYCFCGVCGRCHDYFNDQREQRRLEEQAELLESDEIKQLAEKVGK